MIDRAIETKDQPLEMCGCCEKNPANPSHPCPFKEEFGGGPECECCDKCTGDCAMDI